MHSIPDDSDDSPPTKPLGSRPQLRCPHCRESVIETAESAPNTCPICGKELCPPTEEHHTALKAGQEFGRFILLECVGSGTFGVVWKARDIQLDREVALKVPHKSWLASENYLQRLDREARAAAQLKHANILNFIDVTTVEGMPILIAAFINGVTLEKWLARNEPSYREAARWTAQIADALAYAHKLGFVHRDVKPGNIILEPIAGSNSLKPVLIDFGLALRDEAEIVLTMAGQVVGTPAYMSPEQAQGKGQPIDQRSDIYSLGVVLYKMATGVLPFHGPAPLQIDMVVKGEIRWPRKINPQVPRDLETIILRATAKEPSRRFASATDMATDLRRFLEGRPILSRPVGPAKRGLLWARRNPALAMACGFALCLAVALFVSSVVFVVKQGSFIEELKRKNAWQALETGIRECREYHHVDAGMFWFLRALEEAPKSSTDLDRLARLNLSSWHSQLMPLEEIRSLPRNILQFGVCPQASGAVLAILTSGGKLTLFDSRLAEKKLEGWNQPAGLRAFAFRSDGSLLATGDAQGLICVYELHAGQAREKSRFRASSSITCVTFSANGEQLGIGNSKGAQVWKVATENAPSRLLGEGRPVTDLWFAPDGSLVTMAGPDLVHWLQPTTSLRNSVVTQLPPARGPRANVAMWGNTVAISRGSQVEFIDLNASEEGWKPSIALEATPTLVAFSPDGKTLATVVEQKHLQLWDVANARPITPSQQFRNRISAVLFDSDGESLLIASMNDIVRRLRIPRVDHTAFHLTHPGDIRWLKFSADGTRLMAAFKSKGKALPGLIQFWDGPSSWKQTGKSAAQEGLVSPQLSPDGTLVARGLSNGSVAVIEVDTGHVIFEAPNLDAINHAAWTHRGNGLVVGDQRGAACVWDVAQRVRRFEPWKHTGSVTELAISPDDKNLVVGTTSGEVKVWDLANGKLKYSCPGHSDPIACAAFSPDGRYFVTADNKRSARIWQVADGSPVGEALLHVSSVRSLAWSPNSAMFATGSEDGIARLWNAANGASIGTPIDVFKPVYTVEFSRDGRTLLVFSSAGPTGLWDVATCRSMGPDFGPRGETYSATFHPGGRFVAAGDHEGSVRFWPVPEPAGGDNARLRVWVQVLTGLTDDPAAGGMELSPEEWAEKKRLLDAGGGSPVQ